MESQGKRQKNPALTVPTLSVLVMMVDVVACENVYEDDDALQSEYSRTSTNRHLFLSWRRTAVHALTLV